MSEWTWWIAGGGGALMVAMIFARRPLRHIAEEIQFARAREMYALQRDHLGERFLGAVAASGKPRGLSWRDCELTGNVAFAHDKTTRQLHALVGVCIAFEAVAGSDMEDVQAVGNLRNATALFRFHRGQWQPTGRTFFNMNPDEALAHFQTQLEPAPAKERPTAGGE